MHLMMVMTRVRRGWVEIFRILDGVSGLRILEMVSVIARFQQAHDSSLYFIRLIGRSLRYIPTSLLFKSHGRSEGTLPMRMLLRFRVRDLGSF